MTTVVNLTLTEYVDFLKNFVYTKTIRKVEMNEFEKDVQYKGNDFLDSGVAFVISFVFFAVIFIIATVIKAIGS